MTLYKIDSIEAPPSGGMSMNAVGFVQNLQAGTYKNGADLLSKTCNIPWEAARALVKGEVEHIIEDDTSVIFEYHHRSMTKSEQKIHNKAQKRCDEWNEMHPEGTSVQFKDAFNDLESKTRSIAWVAGLTAVVMIEGKTGGVGLDFLTVRQEVRHAAV